jgi:hypothetical protein
MNCCSIYRVGGTHLRVIKVHGSVQFSNNSSVQQFDIQFKLRIFGFYVADIAWDVLLSNYASFGNT